MGSLTLYEQLEDWSNEIAKVSKKAETEWPNVLPAEDIAQEVYLHILESPKTLTDISDMDDVSRYRTLHKIAQRIVSKERNDYERFSGNFRFSVDEVKSLLEEAADPDAEIGSSWKTGDYTSSGDGPSDPTAVAALDNIKVSHSRMLLSEALKDLSRSNELQYSALINRFVFQQVPASKDSASRMLIDRALHSITTKMNHLHKRNHTGVGVRYNPLTKRNEDDYRPGQTLGDGPGTRSVVSNSTARFLTKQSWDADYTPAPSQLRDNHIEPEVWD